MVAIGKTAWCALMNWKTRTGSCRSPARTRLPPRIRSGASFCQDIALLAQLVVLTAEPAQFLALGRGQTLTTNATITTGLTYPVPDRLRGRLELSRQLLGRAAGPHQIDHLTAELHRIRRPMSRNVNTS